MYNDLPGTGSRGREPANSVVVMRDASHPNNLSGGPEMYVPPRLLYGVVPHCLFEAYDFYQDESSIGDMRGNGTRKVRGYPKDEDATRTIVFVEFGECNMFNLVLQSSSSILFFLLVLPSCSILFFDLVLQSCSSILFFDLVLQSSSSIFFPISLPCFSSTQRLIE